MYKFIDLFAGIGGIRLAFEKHGCECVFSCEWDSKAQITYQENFGEKPVGDIRDISSEMIPDHDILLAGFPCQPFSLAGVSKKVSLGREHGFADETQGTLFFELARIIKEKKPKAFLLENVKNLVSHDKGKTFRVIRRVLEKELGYKLYASIIDAKGLVPQHRERIYMVGFRDALEFEFPDFPWKGLGIGTILEENVPDKYTLTDKLWEYLQNYANKHRAAGNGFGFGLVDLESFSRTLSARYYKDGSEILIPQEGKNPRRLTPRECARLQGFPESYKIVVSDTAAYKQFGNSVSVPVVERIAASLIDSLTENKVSDEYYRGEFNFENIRDEVIARASQNQKFFCKFISTNDTSSNGAHQSGFYISKRAWPLMFDEPGKKGENKDRPARIFWEQLDAYTDNMFKWYGKTKNEYRITRFGKGFPFFTKDYVGDLFILIPISSEQYLGYVLSGDDSDAFLATFSISPINIVATYGIESNGYDATLGDLIEEYTEDKLTFPNMPQISKKSREIHFEYSQNPLREFETEEMDELLLDWIDIEYSIFKSLEQSIYKEQIKNAFENIDDLLEFANSALNRRKKRAGQSFENHLEFIFKQWNLSFSHLGKSEYNNKPEFIFPSNREYADPDFPEERLIFLAVKTSCKDRWRQILQEAERTKIKYLATMEKGVSLDQMDEIERLNVTLVVPKRYHEFYPKEYRDRILSIESFCMLVRQRLITEKPSRELF